MDYVTVRGKDLQDCFMQMKMKYGPQAHVYEQRVITEGGVLGTGFLANKIYEITVAIPEKASSKDRVEKKLNDLRELLKRKSVPSESEENEIRESIPKKRRNNSRELVTAGKTSVSSSNANSSFKKSKNIPTFSDWVNEEDLQIASDEDELPGLSFVEELIHSNREDESQEPKIGKFSPVIKSDLSPSLEKLMDRLVEEGLSVEYSRELVNETRLHLSPMEMGRYSSVLEKCNDVLTDRIRVDNDLFAGTKKGKRKVIFFIGPTGSGKTTTLAKLAAKYNLHMGKTVSLYTTDNYRIAAVEQLKRYADTMDLPFYSVKDIRKFRESLLRDGSELVLVDTAGYSHKDKETLAKMKEFYEALGENDQLENILVISSTVSSSNARQVFRAYEELGYNRVILSKIDETDYLGSFIELADTNTKEFAYLSVGQDVPFDILGAEKKLLAECVVYPEKMKGIAGEVFSKKS